jgi:hypothetical protein
VPGLESHTVGKKQSSAIGGGKPGPGRKPGVPNKSTTLAREAIAKLVDGNADRLQGWLDAIAKDEKHGPMVAWRCMMDVLEYHIPKLARTEHAGDPNNPLRTVSRIELVALGK